MTPLLRVSAYAVCLRDGAVLLAAGLGVHGIEWTLPGGGVDHGEDPRDAAVREVEEETGYTARLDGLLAVDSIRFASSHVPPADLHALRVIYAATVVGGELRFEVDGTTHLAAWVPLDEVAALPRVGLVDIGLDVAQRRLRGELEIVAP